METDKNRPILEIKELKLEYRQDRGIASVLNGVNIDLAEGTSIGVVGESGCGKTSTFYQVMRLGSGAISGGSINYIRRSGENVDIAKIQENSRMMREIRGGEISMIFQEPMASFSPVRSIGVQLAEILKLHSDLPKSEYRAVVEKSLADVGIDHPSQRYGEFSFQFSGGMRQRAMIAMSILANPRILIADEPTSALDVTVQAQVLKVIKNVQETYNIALALITHNMGVVAHIVDYVYIMYLGTVVESCAVEELFDHPQHPYTKGLLNSIPKLSGNTHIESIPGSIRDCYSLPRGCLFADRCAHAFEWCREDRPPLKDYGGGHKSACFLLERP
jgi:peptide/nickel transport system ATP-binding protein